MGKSPVEDLVAAHLDPYCGNIDYQHGRHLTARPTALVTGFDQDSQLRSGSTTARVTDTREQEMELIPQDGSHQNDPGRRVFSRGDGRPVGRSPRNFLALRPVSVLVIYHSNSSACSST